MAKKRRQSNKAATSKVNMTRAQARAYLARWKRVNEFVAAERRAMTPQQKFDELTRLMEWGEQFGWRERPDQDNRRTWDRWNKLREAHCG